MMSQEGAGSQVQSMDRKQCVAYALANNPDLENTRLETGIAELENAINLAAWKPIVGVTGGLTNNWKQQVTIFPDFNNPGETREVVLGQAWTSNLGVAVNQLLYSPEIIRDRNLQSANLQAAELIIETAELDLKADVSTAFYQALRVEEQIVLARSDIERLERNLRDARLFFDEGIVDKVDYKRATIALNQARANLASSLLNLESRKAELKAVMGYPVEGGLLLMYDYDELAAIIQQDTTVALNPQLRPELAAVTVRQEQQDLQTDYLRRAWMPTVGLQGSYTYNWLAQNFGELYNRAFPAGLVNLNLTIPLFNGGARFRSVERATILSEGLDYEEEAIRLRINREYAVADNNYRAGRVNYVVAAENVELAKEIYDVVRLQYREGIEPFLEVVIAENDLRTSQNRALNALMEAVIARVALLRAAGRI